MRKRNKVTNSGLYVNRNNNNVTYETIISTEMGNDYWDQRK